MLAVNYTTLREHLKDYFDKVNDDYETLVVTRKDNRNVVVLSEESYNNIMENMYVRSSRKNYERLLQAKEQVERGEGLPRALIEVDDDD
ncbi:type II toxin-antitoxin system Phd/YefM family antitoxin [Anaerotalea alkaliphila]|uniref:Antitoxin n=1 Tax=Anaerotalea alkaliphila TaxID=2662126 RepID=A0A7X5HTJ8_9FIRM|nr:type II toxin-antitoxin system prevent-host-death family antitoxin [Anaerotalea alkaliphila]NDL66410.1 type II toxin-antitoxin system prevent-host-death family antitoxin [Anaerotalea alkaliphila]